MLIVSRDDVIPVLDDLIVAPVAGTIRDIPTCIPIGAGEGTDHDGVTTFDHLAAVPRSALTKRPGQLGPGRRRPICSALDAMANSRTRDVRLVAERTPGR